MGNHTTRGGTGAYARRAAERAVAAAPRAHVSFFSPNPDRPGTMRESATAPAHVRAAARSLLGRVPTQTEWAGLVGARAGDHVSVSASQVSIMGKTDWTIGLQLMSKNGGYEQHGGYRADRSIQRVNGDLSMVNVKFYVNGSVQGQGIGSAVLARQADTAYHLGITRLVTNPMNEHAQRTWTQLGYHRGTDAYGDPAYIFDTAPSSQSRRTLAAYIATRAARATGQAPAGRSRESFGRAGQ